ncbi:MAG: hypothetical protein HFG80_10220 [Eubacterium sp.]|nr:hypothetical protein [Eubacterium sp.]
MGKIGKCNLSLHGSNGAKLSYESKIRRNENGLYVMRINIQNKKTLKIYQNLRQNMSQYDIEQFANECNAYMIREERKERQERELENKSNSK